VSSLFVEFHIPEYYRISHCAQTTFNDYISFVFLSFSIVHLFVIFSAQGKDTVASGSQVTVGSYHALLAKHEGIGPSDQPPDLEYQPGQIPF
jgi:hypothetical protein